MRWTRVEGDDGPATLVRLGPANRLELAADALLTPSQRAVAYRTAAGESTLEITKSLRCSRGTVRAHLRAAYRRLGVADRVELASALRSKADDETDRPRAGIRRRCDRG